MLQNYHSNRMLMCCLVLLYKRVSHSPSINCLRFSSKIHAFSLFFFVFLAFLSVGASFYNQRECYYVSVKIGLFTGGKKKKIIFYISV